MRKYYTRPCNFHYGNYAKKLIKSRKALPLAGNKNICFDRLEIFERKKGGVVNSNIYSISDINKFKKEKLSIIRKDLKKVTSIRKKIAGVNFDKPNIMGVLNITPDSFSDGGLFFKEPKAYKQANSMIKSGARIIDVGGESTRPGSKIVDEKRNGKG